jgi:hypothetical protein
MKKSLTPEQKSCLPLYREQCRKLALADPDASDNEIRSCVERLCASRGLGKPEVVIFDDPVQCVQASKAVPERSYELRHPLRGQLWGQLKNQLELQLMGQLGDQLRDQLVDHLWIQVWVQFRVQFRDQWPCPLPLYAGGSEWYWLSTYGFARKIGVQFSPDLDEALSAWMRYAKFCGPMYVHKGQAFVSRRPNVLHFDDEQRLHCDTGPAMAFRSGWSLYATHGVRQPHPNPQPQR